MVKRKVLFVLGALPVGGAETQAIQAARHLDSSLYEVTICSLGSKGPLGQEFEQSGGCVIHLGASGSPWSLRSVVKLARLMQNLKPDIVHTYLFGGNTQGRFAAWMVGTPVIIGDEQNINSWKTRWHRAVDRWLAQRSAAIVACSEAVKQYEAQQSRIPEDRFAVIYNSIDEYRFVHEAKPRAKVRAEFGIDSEPVIAAVGRLVEAKGYPSLLDAMPKVLGQVGNVHLLLVGTGPLEATLDKQVKSLGLERNVTLVGLRRDIPDLLRAVDVFVMPSVREGFGIAAAEAMYCGLPVVATNLPALAEVVVDGLTGKLVPPSKPEALAVALVDLLQQPTLMKQMGEAGRQRAELLFTTQRHVGELAALYGRFEKDRSQLRLSC